MTTTQTAASYDPNRPDTFLELSKAYRQAGQPQKEEQARKQFQTLRETADRAGTLEKRCLADPANFENHLEMGLLSLKMHDLPRAEYYLNKAAALRPQDAKVKQALSQLATLDHEGGN